jgi:hypothetical protein
MKRRILIAIAIAFVGALSIGWALAFLDEPQTPLRIT